MKYTIIGAGIVGQALHEQAPDSVLYARGNTVPIEHDVLVIAAPTGNRLVVNADPEKDLEDCNNLIELVSQCQYNQLVYISTVDVYRTHRYGTNRQYLENALAKLPNSHVVRLPSLIGQSVNKNILYDLKTMSWLDKICLDSTIQWYPLKRLKNDIENIIHNRVKYQNLCSEPISNHEIVQKFFPKIVDQLLTNQLTPANYDLKPYTIPLEEIWQSFDEFFIDRGAKLVYNKQSKEN
jgi:hypothetical protein